MAVGSGDGDGDGEVIGENNVHVQLEDHSASSGGGLELECPPMRPGPVEPDACEPAVRRKDDGDAGEGKQGQHGSTSGKGSSRTAWSIRQEHGGNAPNKPAENHGARTTSVTDPKSLRLTPTGRSAVQLWTKALVQHDLFTALIYCCIFFNTVTIGISDVSIDRDPKGFAAGFIEISDWIILAIFTMEMLIKIVAYGPGYKMVVVEGESDEEAQVREYDADEESGGYFSVGWNRFDFIVVILSWMLVVVQSLSGADQSITRLVRAFRVARPLRALRSFEGTQDVLLTFPASIPAMRDVLTLLLFVFFVFAILGMNLFGLGGEWHGRCVVDDDSYGTKGLLMLGHLALIEPLCGDGYDCGEGFRCSCHPATYENGTVESAPYSFQHPITGDPGCKNGGWADHGDSWTPLCPNSGFECFDNFALAILSCFTSITLDSWSFRMWWAQDTNGETIGSIYFISLVVIVSFYLLNLNVAVISFAYKEVRERRREINKLREKLKRAGRIVEQPAKQSLSSTIVDMAKQASTRLFRTTPYADLPPLNRVAMFSRRISQYPSRVDECGCVVPLEVLRSADACNVAIEFGPGKGDWSLSAGPGGCTKMPVDKEDGDDEDGDGGDGDVDDRKGAEGIKIEEGASLESGSSLDEPRSSLRAAIDKYRELKPRNVGERPAAYMDVAILALILANTACMACEHFVGSPIELDPGFLPGDNCCDSACRISDEERCPRGVLTMSPSWVEFLFWTEAIFNLAFTAETSIRLLAAWNFRRYIVENFPSNLVDFFIVVASDTVFILDLFLPSLVNVAMFRLIRVMRAVRVLSRFRRLQVLLHKAVASLKTIMNVLFVLVFWFIVFAMLGMQIFRCDVWIGDACVFTDKGECPEGCSSKLGDTCYFTDDEMYENCPWSSEHNFDSFGMSMIELIYVLTGENWVDSMSMGMQSTSSAWPGLLFFIIFYVVAFFMIFNLLIGVILEEFELNDDEKEALQMGTFRLQVLKQLKRKYFEKKKIPGASSGLHGGLSSEHTGMWEGVNLNEDDEFGAGDQSAEAAPEPSAPAELRGKYSFVCFCLPPPMPNADFPDAPRNFRGYADLVATSAAFERFILLTICASAALLALDSPIPSLALTSPDVIQISDYVFLAVFAVEFVVKILAYGFFWEHEQSYFRSLWNLLDFIILFSQILDVAGLIKLKALRAIRVVRPLRLLNKIESLQLLLKAVQSSTTDMMNVLLLWLFAFVIFSILGVNLFAGSLLSCNDGDFVGPDLNPGVQDSLVGYRDGCVGIFFTLSNDSGESYVSDDIPTGILRPRVWANPSDSISGWGYNFDNFAMAMQTLFEVSTFEMWSDTSLGLMGVTNVGQQPIAMSVKENIAFVHAWVVLSCFFVLQLVIGVLIDAINQKSGTALCTDLQRNWMTMRVRIQQMKPISFSTEPVNPVRKKVYRFVNSELFQGFITVVIVINILLMVTESDGQAQWWTDAITMTNVVFIVIYVLEICIKLLAYLHEFFLDAWNLFDVIVVLASIIETVVESGGGLQALRAVRMLKVFRALRLVRRARRLRTMIRVLLQSLPPIISSMVFMMLLIFFFATVGVQFFGGVKWGTGIHRRNNFDNAINGLLLLIRATTGENWETVMHDCALEPPFCTSNEEAMIAIGEPFGDCGSAVGAYIFFDLFMLLGMNFVVNLFVAVLLENFFQFQMQDSFVLSEEHLFSYQKRFAELDPDGTGTLPVSKLRLLIENLHKDLNPLSQAMLASEIKYRSVRMEVVDGQPEGAEIAFTNLLMTLALHVVGSHGLPYADMIKRQEMLVQYTAMASVSSLTHAYRSIKQDEQLQFAEQATDGTPKHEKSQRSTHVQTALEARKDGLMCIASGNKDRIRAMQMASASITPPPSST